MGYDMIGYLVHPEYDDHVRVVLDPVQCVCEFFVNDYFLLGDGFQITKINVRPILNFNSFFFCDEKITVIDLVKWEVAGEIFTGDEPDGMAWTG